MSAFKRMYVDVPSDLHASMKTRCAELGKSQANFIREAIAEKLNPQEEKSKHGSKKENRRA